MADTLQPCLSCGLPTDDAERLCSTYCADAHRWNEIGQADWDAAGEGQS